MTVRVEYLEALKGSGFEDSVFEMLQVLDQEFLPPLSTRNSIKDANFVNQDDLGSLRQYFDSMIEQKILLLICNATVSGFLSFRTNYTIPGLNTPTGVYISTIGILETARGRGFAKLLYKRLSEYLRNSPELVQVMTTRTWSTNFAHLKLLGKLGFEEVNRVSNGGGDGIDTVVYVKHLFPYEYAPL